MEWDMSLDGPPRARTEIQALHKGSGSRGISAPGKDTGMRNIMLWWRPEIGETFGYSGGWTEDGTAFYYSGTGQEGDQVFAAPHIENKRVRDHAATGDHVRLLRYVAKNSGI
jgi:5-methylcytosine-specific restriction protein A